MKKIGLIVLVVVLALGALGAAYAQWSQALTVNGTVNTGFISASFDPNVGGVPTDANPLTTVAMARGYTGASDAKGTGLWDVLNVTVTNAYPGYSGQVEFYVDNNGTVPFTVGGVTINNGNATIIAVSPTINSGLVVTPGSYNGPYYLAISVPGTVGGAVDPAQNGTYTFSVGLIAQQ